MLIAEAHAQRANSQAMLETYPWTRTRTHAHHTTHPVLRALLYYVLSGSGAHVPWGLLPAARGLGPVACPFVLRLTYTGTRS